MRIEAVEQQGEGELLLPSYLGLVVAAVVDVVGDDCTEIEGVGEVVDSIAGELRMHRDTGIDRVVAANDEAVGIADDNHSFGGLLAVGSSGEHFRSPVEGNSRDRLVGFHREQEAAVAAGS